MMTWQPAQAGAPRNDNYTRRGSFVERYVIARASTFTKGKEKEEAWLAAIDAEAIYAMIQQRDQGMPDAQETTQQTIPAFHRAFYIKRGWCK